jgi:hypothetical protein
MNPHRLPTLGLFTAMLGTGCLFSGDKRELDCHEPGLARSDASNWFEYSDSMTVRSKYPFRYEIRLYNERMKSVATSAFEIDSSIFGKLALGNPKPALALKWLPVDDDGNPLPSGCYKLGITVHALYQAGLSPGDVPNTIDQGVSAEYILQYIRERP